MILTEERPPRLLLDTCAIIYLFNGEPIAKNAIDATPGRRILRTFAAIAVKKA